MFGSLHGLGLWGLGTRRGAGDWMGCTSELSMRFAHQTQSLNAWVKTCNQLGWMKPDEELLGQATSWFRMLYIHNMFVIQGPKLSYLGTMFKPLLG